MSNQSPLQLLLNQFQQQYPAASLVAELVTVHQDNFVVRALVQMAGVTLASGMAAHIDVEAAEDRAKIRSLEALGLNLGLDLSLDLSLDLRSDVGVNPAHRSETSDRYALPSPTELPPLSESLLASYRPAVEIDASLQSSDSVTASGAIASVELAAAPPSASNWSNFDDEPFGDRHFPSDTRLPDPGNYSSDFDPGPELTEIPELSELVESPDFDGGFDSASFNAGFDGASFDAGFDGASFDAGFDDARFDSASLADSDFGAATPAPAANLYDDVTQSAAASTPVAPAIDKPTTDKLTLDKPTSDKPTSDKPTSDKPKSSRKKSSPTSESSVTPSVAPAADSLAVSSTVMTPVRERSDDIARIGLEMKRLGWTTDKGRDYIKTVYGKRSRQELSDDELGDFLNYLENQ